METNNTTENNRLIAEFMGLTPVKCFGRYSISVNHCTCNEDTAEKALNGFAKIAKYSTDWNWLMPVVEKIEQGVYTTIYRVTITSDCCKIHSTQDNTRANNYYNNVEIGETKITATYKAVVEFIKWYNLQSK